MLCDHLRNRNMASSSSSADAADAEIHTVNLIPAFQFRLYRTVKIFNKAFLTFQLTFRDQQVADFLEELGSYLESHLAALDAVSQISWYN